MSFKKSFPKLLAIAIVIISACLWGLKYFSSVDSWEQKSLANVEADQEVDLAQVEEAEESTVGLSCHESMPKSGSKYLLAGEGLGKHAKLFIGNEHASPVWVRIFEDESSEEYGAIFLEAHKNSQFWLPVNGYKVIVESGAEWCNLQKRFNDAALIHSDKVIHILENETASLRLMSYGPQPADIMLSLSNSANMADKSAKQIHGRGTLTLERVIGGHYAVKGSVNGVVANFLVDTEASRVSLPESFAKHAGITACKKSKVITANGISDICIAKARELTLGQFTLKNVTVNYGKGIPEDTLLLGMNVISQFRMVQHNDVMELSIR